MVERLELTILRAVGVPGLYPAGSDLEGGNCQK